MWISNGSGTLCWKMPEPLIWPSNYVGTLANSLLTIITSVHFWNFSSIPFIYMFILMLVPLCFDYCIFVVSFEIGKIFNFVLFQVNLGLSVPCIFSRIDFQFLQKKNKKQKTIWDFDRECLESARWLLGICVLTYEDGFSIVNEILCLLSVSDSFHC